MAQNTRQTNLLVQQDWTKVYQAFANADFASYDFETLRSTMINYIKTYYPDTFNDFLESSEYLALIDMIAFLGQSLSFRTDLNARENFIDTAQRRDSILKLARMINYNPKRNTSASGLLKIDTIRTTETLTDSSGINLSNQVIHWNDSANANWLEQFNTVLNASLTSSQTIGKPGNSQRISGVQTDEYKIALNVNTLPVGKFSSTIQGVGVDFEAVSATTVGKNYIYENSPVETGFNILYRNDNNGNSSNNTGYFLYFKQGALHATNFNITNSIPNNFVPIATNNINNDDHWLYTLDVNSTPSELWNPVPALPGVNVIYNQLSNKNLYQINTNDNDQVTLVFGDGSFANIPQSSFRYYYRVGNGANYTIAPSDLAVVSVVFTYLSKKNTLENLTITASLRYTVTNAAAAETLASIKTNAPQQYYTQNRMVTGEDYNILPQTQFGSIQKIKVVNRTSSGVSLYLDALDPTGSFSSTNIFGDDGILKQNSTAVALRYDFINTNDIYSKIYSSIVPVIASTEMINYYYDQFDRQTAPSNVLFSELSSGTNTSAGYLKLSSITQQVGSGIGTVLKYVDVGAVLEFTLSGQTIFAAVTDIISNSSTTTPSLVTLGRGGLDGATLVSIMPAYKTTLSTGLITTIISQIRAQVNFGIMYDQANQTWVNILPADIGATSDSGWMLKFTYSLGSYTIAHKSITYTFGSTDSTKFYFDPAVRVYDSMTAQIKTDEITILKINSQPGSNSPMASNVVWQIYNSVVAPDGYVDDSQVYVKFPSTQMENVPDNLDLFTTVSNTSTRNGLYFQYKHRIPARNRIDPTPVNLMDMYILTADYTSSYIAYLRDLTGSVIEPSPPTSSSLEIAYSSLDNYKTISDTMIFNPAKFKPLFGSKAESNLRARFQVVKNPASNITDNEIKSRVIDAVNAYFDLANWDFGESFYFSELAAYLHTKLIPNIASVLIVPVNADLIFGNYFQINAEPWEIVTSAATVNDVDVVSAVTASSLGLNPNYILNNTR